MEVGEEKGLGIEESGSAGSDDALGDVGPGNIGIELVPGVVRYDLDLYGGVSVVNRADL